MKFANKNIGYIIWLENLNYNVLVSQVFQVLIEARKSLSKDQRYYIIAFQDIRSFLRNIIKDYKEKARLKDSDLRVIIIPVITFSKTANYFYAKWAVLIFIVLPQALFWLFFIVLFKKIEIMHCRSYIATLSACLLKAIFRIKVIFDPRSPFIEEAILSEKIRKGTLSHKLWLFFESFIVRKADIVVVIADSFVQYFKTISSTAKFVMIPNNVDTNKFAIDILIRKDLRKQFGFSDKDIVLCYSGSLGKQWNDPAVYGKFASSMLKQMSDYKFLFLTTQKDNLESELIKRNIDKDCYKIYSVSLEDMPHYLSVADYGLNLMQHDDIRLSIKTVEYLSMGLPLIITTNVKGAMEIVRKYGVGYAIEKLDDINFQEFNECVANRELISKRCREAAVKYYSTEVVGNKYSKLYKSMLTEYNHERFTF
jgi:glycosyltransferase involved in cell wall biosynthesis